MKMFNPVKAVKEILNIKRKYYILNVIVAKGYSTLALEYSDFIDKTLSWKTDEEIIDDICEMIEESKELAISLEN